MLRSSFVLPDPEMPRTVFYERLSDSIRALPGFVADAGKADIVFPAEDTSVEQNWPRFARPESAYVRGGFDEALHHRYLARALAVERPICVVNMHPFIRVPLMAADRPQVIVADINLLESERAANPRTISMPALPVTVGRFEPAAKTILAGFRGAESHPCRGAIAALNGQGGVVAELVSRDNHSGKIDALAGSADPAYVDLLRRSIFAFVPRGEAEFSYRLPEVMSFGCIPILVADGLVPPFDRSLNWREFALLQQEARIGEIPAILAQLPPGRVAAMQRGVEEAYRRCLDGTDRVAATLLAEAEMILASKSRGALARLRRGLSALGRFRSGG